MCDRIKRDTGFTENITPIRFRTTVLTDLYDQTKDIKLAQAAAAFLMESDSGLLCDAYHSTELGETDCIRMLIMDSRCYPKKGFHAVEN